MSTFKRCFELIFVLSIVLILTEGCDRSKTILQPEQPEVIPSPIVSGVIIYRNGIEVASSFQDEVYGEKIRVEKGENSDIYSVLFLDEFEDPLPEFNDSSLRLECITGDPACLQLQKNTDLGQWEFHICGRDVGQTELIIYLKKFQQLQYKSPGIPTAVM
jgi:hypothetical protein